MLRGGSSLGRSCLLAILLQSMKIGLRWGRIRQQSEVKGPDVPAHYLSNRRSGHTHDTTSWRAEAHCIGTHNGIHYLEFRRQIPRVDKGFDLQAKEQLQALIVVIATALAMIH